MIGKQLELCRELSDNIHDRRAFCIKKGGAIVGHAPPREIFGRGGGGGGGGREGGGGTSAIVAQSRAQ